MATRKAKAKAPKDRPRPRRQPETLRLRKLTPMFTATDLQRSMAFYRDVLGFVIGDEWRENGELSGCEIHAGAITFMLNQDDFKKGRDRQKGVGTRIWCHTARDVLRVVAATLVDTAPADLGDRVALRIASLPRPADRAELDLLLRLLDVAAVNLLLSGTPKSFTRMSPGERERCMRGWATSRLPQRRKAFQALKRLTTVTHYTTPGAARAIGHPGPLGPPPSTPK